MTELSERVAIWLRPFDLGSSTSPQTAVLGAAGSLAETRDLFSRMNLVLLAHRVSTDDTAQRVADAINAEDETWGVRPEDDASSVTAAIAVALSLEEDPNDAVPFALGVESAAFCNLDPVLPELPDLARAALVRSSEVMRARFSPSLKSPDLKGVFGEAAVPDGHAINSTHLNLVMKGTTSAVTRTVNAVSKVIEPMKKRLAAAEEELNLLWWVFGGYSELVDTPFASLPKHAAGIVGGSELAGLLNQPCPLPATRSLLSRVLGTRATDTSSIAQAIPAALTALRGTEPFPEGQGHRLLPIFSSAHEYRDLEGKSLWKEAAETKWKANVEADHAQLALAEETIRELLLLRERDS